MNVVFAPLDCTVIDLMLDKWIDLQGHPWIHRLTNIMGQNYVALLGKLTWIEDVSSDGDQNESIMGRTFKYSIDVSKMLHAVKATLGF
jgi:hypothetical protein